MSQLNFKIWEIPGLDLDRFDYVFLDSVTYDSDLVIKIGNTQIDVILTFRKFISFRLADESHLLDYWGILDKKRENGYVFYKVVHSGYFDEIKRLSYNLVCAGDDGVEQYGIFSMDGCVEILSNVPPDIVIIEKSDALEQQTD